MERAAQIKKPVMIAIGNAPTALIRLNELIKEGEITIVPIETPTMHEAVGYLAKIGGFLGRKEDGEPGAQVIWRGLKELNIVLKYYKYFSPSNYH